MTNQINSCCSKCGVDVTSDSKFCGKCGYSLRSEGSVNSSIKPKKQENTKRKSAVSNMKVTKNKKQNELPMSWSYFYRGLLLVGIIFLLFGLPYTILGFVINPIWYYGLYKMKKWGWQLNKALLIVELILAPIVIFTTEDFSLGISCFMFFAVILWCAGNLKYFEDRKGLFTN